MSERDERHSYKGRVERAYAYYKKYGIVGSIGNGWHWLLAKPERLTALSTLAIFIASVVAAGIGVAQWRTLKGQLWEMQATSGQTNILIDANKRLADAAVKSAQSSEDALKLTKTQLRAYVALVPPDVFNVVAQGNAVTIYAQFTNNGQTPARAVERSVGLSTQAPSEDFKEAITEPGKLDINPGALTPVVERSLPNSLTAEEVESVKDGNSKIYVFGTIKFQDAFGDRQEIGFCFEYFGSGQDFPQGFGYPGFMAKPCTK